jgi:hypothetical protein
MEQFTEFITNHFFSIWLVFAFIIFSIFFIGGRAAIRKLGSFDLSKAVYIEKSASGYSAKGLNSGLGGSRKTLHIIITDTELILTTYLMFAFIAERIDLMQRIPLNKIIHTEIQQKKFYSKLIVRYESDRGKLKDMVISSKNNVQIKMLLDKQINIH